jgi:hypothetical protein
MKIKLRAREDEGGVGVAFRAPLDARLRENAANERQWEKARLRANEEHAMKQLIDKRKMHPRRVARFADGQAPIVFGDRAGRVREDDVEKR